MRVKSSKRITLLIDGKLSREALNVVHRARQSFGSLVENKIDAVQSNTWAGLPAALFRKDALLLTGSYSRTAGLISRLNKSIWCVDPKKTAHSQWNWFYAINEIATNRNADWERDHSKLLSLTKRLVSLGLSKCYVFGTGPSLASAHGCDFSSGYRIICNTICKAKSLFDHIRPHVIVAGDALYHFGDTLHAECFRRDLHQRLKESDCAFLYPEVFRLRVENEFSDVCDQCYPVATSLNGITPANNQVLQFSHRPNVLGSMLLPLACHLSKEIHLLGFDGKKPEDKLFWSNHPEVTYPGLIEIMADEYPSFFHHYVPPHDPQRYSRLAHGDLLESALNDATQRGWQFRLLAPSVSPALSKLPVLA